MQNDARLDGTILGLDIGGANIKYSCGLIAGSAPFPMWQNPMGLVEQLTAIRDRFPATLKVAITMTGELADCFSSKAEGVNFIVNTCSAVFNRQTAVYYSLNGAFVCSRTALSDPLAIASANWHAMAWYAARFLNQRSGFLFDMGSTTVDLIPVENGSVVAKGLTDLGRLRHGELVYCGAKRTPIHSLISSANIGSETIPVAREFFATIGDAMIVTGRVAERETDVLTADGKPATIVNSARRLARMVCADAEELAERDITEIASASVHALKQVVVDALTKVARANPSIPLNFALAGQGTGADELMSETIAEAHLNPSCVLRLSSEIGNDASVAGPAVAVATLVKELA